MILENSTKKLMILTVGTGTDGKDIAHGLFFSIKNQNPDLLVLIASLHSSKITFPFLKRLITEYGRNIEIEEIINDEINDFEFLHNKYLELIINYINKGYSPRNIIVDYTSGTKAMSAALVSASVAAEVSTISYVIGERKNGRVLTGTERLSTLEPTSIYSSKILQQSVSFFNSYRFESTITLLREAEIHPDHNIKSAALLKLADFFSLWDKFNFNRAFNTLSSVSDTELRLYKLKGKFQKVYTPLLLRLKDNELNIQKVDDLIFNASRRAEEGKYDDAVARLYRALEMIGQIEFEAQFRCKTDDVNLDNIPSKFKKKLEFYHRNKKENKIQASLFITFEILNQTGSYVAKIFKTNKEQIQKNISKRNHSILAHGSLPIDEKGFEEFYGLLTEKFHLANKSNRNPDFSFPEIKYAF